MALRNPKLRLLALALVAFSFTAQAKRDEAARLELSADATTATLAEQRASIEGAIKDTEDYVELRASDRKQVRDAMDQMATQLETAGTLAALSDTDRKALLAQQDEVNAILKTAHGDSRLVCTREKEMGSNFRRSVCLTVAQRRRQADSAQQMNRPGS
jgi:hypothetical protein